MSFATSARPAAFRSQSTTRAPWRPSASAVARPIPEAAPLTAATLSVVMIPRPLSELTSVSPTSLSPLGRGPPFEPRRPPRATRRGLSRERGSSGAKPNTLSRAAHGATPPAMMRRGAHMDRRRDLTARVTMRYRPFGRTELQVSVVGFGCWPMAGDRYGAIEDDAAVKAIHRALDRGVNCVDTAPAYGAGHSEEVVARALEVRRRDVILVTKCGVKVPPPGEPGPLRDASRANILREVDLSLKRLRTDWVDVLLVHWPDADTPFEETMRALEEVGGSGGVPS